MVDHRSGFRSAIATLALLASTWISATGAPADEAQARQLFTAMSIYFAEQMAFSFDYDSSLEVVTTDGQKLSLASSGAVAIERPDRLHVTSSGGFASVEATFDVATLTLLNRTEIVYAEAAAPGTIYALVDVLRDTYGWPLPATDLLLSDVEGALMPLVTDVKDLGSAGVGGVECDHLALRTEEVDW